MDHGSAEFRPRQPSDGGMALARCETSQAIWEPRPTKLPHGTAQNRRDKAHFVGHALGAPSFSPYRKPGAHGHFLCLFA